jgi:quercetin dioxygenase-like cupin family protein
MERRFRMNAKRLFILITWLAGLWLIVGLWPASGQQAPPTENKGVKTDALAAIDLGPEIDGMQGRQLRLRLITVEPGGVLGLHSHKDRPAVARVLQGALTLHTEGGGTKEYKEGESWSEGKETTHWGENKGTKPAVLIGGDIFKQ